MKIELAPKYNHKEVENGKYDFWLKGEYFKSGDTTKKPFCIVTPPPNVTGKLHLGHAWDTTLQDIIIRRKRMQGYDTLWLPGMDHAGIATQAKIDQKLKNMGISRYDLGREKFLEVAWDWKKEYADFIREQWGYLGLSYDYSKERFTLDEGLNKAVNKVFIDLYNKGLLYRGERIINWDCQAKTALSNIEVEYKEIEGAFYHIKYYFENSDEYLIIATTRPETMFADMALMVNPNDTRYQKYIGKTVLIPISNRKIPVISDEYVDKDFGTGCVKVTPAHDPNDFEVGKRHNLEMPLCMNDDGTMNEMALKYNKLDRFECRKQLIKDLEDLGYLVKIEKHVHQVGHSERTNVIVEPRLSKQWFIKMKPLAEQALKCNTTEFVPPRFKKILDHWLNNIQDWCVSRQLWWGHRIPAYYKGDEVYVGLNPKEGFVQDEDVLDTWFSSALWPFSTLGWPDNTDLYQRYYPNNVLVTGYDIIPFWVMRMIFQGIEFTGKSPFNECVIHGLIRDEQGRKMSKSLGNGVDPIELCNEYGADAMRYFLNTNVSAGMDLRFEKEKMESSWNFINKLWNISRYVLMTLDDNYKELDLKNDCLNKNALAILTKLNHVIDLVDYNFDKYEFGEAARVLYNFIWDDFASWYIELSKVEIAKKDPCNTQGVLVYVLDKILKLMHPFMPFVTEEIYQKLPCKKESSIVISNWPVNNKINDIEALNDIELLKEIIVSNRNIRNEMNKPLQNKLNTYITCDNLVKEKIISLKDYLIKFINPNELFIENKFEFNTEMVNTTLDKLVISYPLNELVDIEKEIIRLNLEKEKLENELKRSNNLLNNPSFLSKANPKKIEEEKTKYQNYLNKYEKINEQIINLRKKK